MLQLEVYCFAQTVLTGNRHSQTPNCKAARANVQLSDWVYNSGKCKMQYLEVWCTVV